MLLDYYKSSLFNDDGAFNLKCTVVHTTFKAQAYCSWYFDFGCFHHMTQDKCFFINFVQVNDVLVTFW